MKWNTKNTQLASKINDGQKYENGEVLNSDSLNSVIDEVLLTTDFIRDLIGSDLMDILTKDIVINWTYREGVMQEKVFTLKYGKFPFYIKAEIESSAENLIDIVEINPDDSTQLSFRIAETEALNVDLGYTLDLFCDLSFYLNLGKPILLSKKRLEVIYNPLTGGPND